MSAVLLSVRGLEAGYAGSQVLFGVDLEVRRSEVVSLLGRNGMGKTTTIRAIMGLTPPLAGSIRFDGREIAGLAPEKIARRGIGLVPEGRRVFPTLTVQENLVATASSGADRPDPWSLDRIYQMFPRLVERRRQRAGTLSGGEQQMLAIARAMMLEPKIVLLDEPTEGLMPRMVSQIAQIIDVLHREGVAILLVEQNVPLTLKASDRVYIMEKGVVRHHAPASELRADDAVVHKYLGV